MMLITPIFLSRLPLVGIFMLASCHAEQPAQTQVSTPEIVMPSVTNEKLQHPSPDNDYSIEEINLLSKIIKAVSRVMSQGIIEITSEPMLDDVLYQSPKDIRKPITYASGRKTLEGLDGNGFVRRYGYAFRRIDDNSAWTDARIGVSSGTVRSTLNLSQDFFLNELGLIFDNAEFSNDPEGVPVERNVFYFHSADNKLKYAFYARIDDSNIKDEYPKNFFNVKITKFY